MILGEFSFLNIIINPVIIKIHIFINITDNIRKVALSFPDIWANSIEIKSSKGGIKNNFFIHI